MARALCTVVISSMFMLAIGCVSPKRLPTGEHKVRLGYFMVDGQLAAADLAFTEKQLSVSIVIGKKPGDEPTPKNRFRIHLEFAGRRAMEVQDHEIFGWGGGGDVSEIHRFDVPIGVTSYHVTEIVIYLDDQPLILKRAKALQATPVNASRKLSIYESGVLGCSASP